MLQKRERQCKPSGGTVTRARDGKRADLNEKSISRVRAQGKMQEMYKEAHRSHRRL